MNADGNDLIQRHIAGLATDEEATRLASALKTDDALADLYVRHIDLEVALEARAASSEATRELLTAPTSNRPTRWLSWRPAAAAAAGVVLGGLMASLAWAIVSPRLLHERELQLADGGFELETPRGMNGVPTLPGRWSGDLAEVIGEHGAVRPYSGTRMLRFKATGNELDREGTKSIASDLWQVLALPGTGERTVKVQAWLNAETHKQARFHLMAMASPEGPQSAPEVWDRRYADSRLVPAAARTMVFVDQDPATWERGDVALHVPAHARTLIIGIAAYRLPDSPASEWFPAQFVDDIKVTMTEEVQP